MKISDLIFGRPLASADEEQEKIGVAKGVPVFGLDALGSAAYGPEAVLALLIPIGVPGLRYITPSPSIIIALLVTVYFSYRQTIAAYPQGGGSYTVALQGDQLRVDVQSGWCGYCNYTDECHHFGGTIVLAQRTQPVGGDSK